MPFRERIKTIFDKDKDGTLDIIQKWRSVKNQFRSYWSESHWSVRARTNHIASFRNDKGTTEAFDQTDGITLEDEFGNDVPAIKNGVFAEQHYEQIRDKCLSEGSFFIDPMFPPEDSSLYANADSDKDDAILWKRATQISEDAQMFTEGATRFDINQGSLGNCWLLAAMANLTLCTPLLNKVVPTSQSFEKDYVGIFHFR